MTLEHNFAESLKESHAAEDLPFWAEVYQKAFPTMVAIVNHRSDGWHQRQGVDRSITLANSKQILVDEKVRGRNKITGVIYGDIALEYMSDEERKIPGWVCKSLLADYIAYAIAPVGKCYLLPVLQLQQAWERHKAEWLTGKPIRAHNRYNGRTWVTLSVGVPVPTLFRAIGECLRVSFTPLELNE